MTGFRLPNAKEKHILDVLSSQPFQGADEIKSQLLDCEVKTIDDEGSLQLKIKTPANKAAVTERVPVEAKLKTTTYPIYFLLHVIDGYATELEVYQADGPAIDLINTIENFSEIEVFY